MHEKKDNIYCYDSEVLINKFDEKNFDRFKIIETNFTAARILLFQKEKPPEIFNLDYLRYIHKYIFQDIYNWAGQIRNIEISKGQLWFARCEFIENEAYKLFKKLKEENNLSSYDTDEFCKRIAYYKTEINMIHPFREGNGRAIREFIIKLGMYNGYNICFNEVSKEEYLDAMYRSPYDDTKLYNIIKKITKKVKA